VIIVSFQETLTQWNTVINIIITITIFISYQRVLFGKKSFLTKVAGDWFGNDMLSKANVDDVRLFINIISNGSMVVAGIDLATVAFVTSGVINNPSNVDFVVGIVMMLLSVVLLFWSFGFSVHTLLGINRTPETQLVMIAFRIMTYLSGLGLFFFLIGLLWAVSTINPLFSVITAIGHFIVTGVLFAVGNRANVMLSGSS
jgi:hypothetical protein